MKKRTITLTIAAVIVIVNDILTAVGKPVLPVSAEDITLVLNVLLIPVVGWFNNSFTKKAQAADRLMHSDPTEEVQDVI
jgi:SPP1 family holin